MASAWILLSDMQLVLKPPEVLSAKGNLNLLLFPGYLCLRSSLTLMLAATGRQASERLGETVNVYQSSYHNVLSSYILECNTVMVALPQNCHLC